MRANRTGIYGESAESPVVHRRKYPQATLVRSLLDRRLMALADRGGSSGFVGDAWGAFCATWLTDSVGRALRVNAEIDGVVQWIVDVDGIPTLAAFASSRGLQNPDFLIGLQRPDGETLIVPVDAKFSIETAKPRQVSAEMATQLIDAPGSPVMPRLVGLGRLVDGFFLGPDYELTHQVLGGTVGILRTSVQRSQVHLLTAPADTLLGDPHVRNLAMALANVDRARQETERALTSALYYVRCAFSCRGAWTDISKPLLGPRNGLFIDSSELLLQLELRAKEAFSAWTLVQQWDAEAEEVRSIRIAVHQAAEVGISNRDLRTLVEQTAARMGMDTVPSLNRVRRELAHWSTAELVERFGVVFFPVQDMSALLTGLRSAARELQADVPARVREIVSNMPPLLSVMTSE